MVKLACEACGGADLIKQGDFFVCQFCGVKYTPSDMRSMLGTVKIDNTDKVKNFYQLARRAKDENNSENAVRYYDMILIEDPTSWEASFFYTYFKAYGCKLEEIELACNSVKNSIKTVLTLIKDYVDTSDEQEKAILEVANRCQSLSTVLYYKAFNHYVGLNVQVQGQYFPEMINRCYAATSILYTLGNNINSIFSTNIRLRNIIVAAWKDGIKMHCGLLNHIPTKKLYKNMIKEYVLKVQQYEPTFKGPNVNFVGGCYIATSVYGSYDCPEVWTLRRYRDNVLATSWYGRLFIRCYYSVSPTLVKLFGNTRWFNAVWLYNLNNMVHKLQLKGFTNTPYEDKPF